MPIVFRSFYRGYSLLRHIRTRKKRLAKIQRVLRVQHPRIYYKYVRAPKTHKRRRQATVLRNTRIRKVRRRSSAFRSYNRLSLILLLSNVIHNTAECKRGTRIVSAYARLRKLLRKQSMWYARAILPHLHFIAKRTATVRQ